MKKYLLVIFLFITFLGCATTKPTPVISSLMDAAVQGKTDTVALLLKQGADVNAALPDGEKRHQQVSHLGDR